MIATRMRTVPFVTGDFTVRPATTTSSAGTALMRNPAIANGASKSTPIASHTARLNRLVGVACGTSSSSVTPSASSARL